MSDHRRTLSVLVLCAAIAAPAAATQFGLGILKRDSKPAYEPFKDPSGRFSLEYPRDWQLVPGAGDVVVTFAQKKSEAALAVERFRMNQALAPDEITDLFTSIETDVLKDRQPKATDVVSKLIDNGGLRTIVIDYARPGLHGPERARQYSIPVGQDLYRLTGSAPVALFDKYQPAFAHAAESFRLGDTGATAAAASVPGAR